MILPLLGYLLLGLLLVVVLFVQEYRESGTFFYSYNDSFYEKYFLPAVVFPLVVVAWPAFVAFALFKKEEESQPPQSKDFSVTAADLGERLSREDIERREIVADPMGATPLLPFGHLNAAWRSFADALNTDDVMWSFVAEWDDGYRKERREGYAVVRGSAVGPYFLSAVQRLNSE